MLNRKILRLYLCTDSGMAGDRPLPRLVADAIAGGVTMVQVREKKASARALYALALELKALCAAKGVPMVINDRLDIALAVGADGVHLGQSDLPAAEARRILGEKGIVGVSASTPRLALQAAADGADYLGVGAMYPTGTKEDIAGVIGPGGMADIRAVTGIPIVGIGGINAYNADKVLEAGADGVAVISAVLRAPDCRAAASRLREVGRAPWE